MLRMDSMEHRFEQQEKISWTRTEEGQGVDECFPSTIASLAALKIVIARVKARKLVRNEMHNVG